MPEGEGGTRRVKRSDGVGIGASAAGTQRVRKLRGVGGNGGQATGPFTHGKSHAMRYTAAICFHMTVQLHKEMSEAK